MKDLGPGSREKDQEWRTRLRSPAAQARADGSWPRIPGEAFFQQESRSNFTVSPDGMTVLGYFTLPRKREPGNLPLVVYTHCGPWLRDTHGFNDISQFFANRGYLVLECNDRGSRGYGVEFQMAGYRHLGRKMQDDITDGLQWLVAQGLADRRRVAICGFSSGGCNVLAGFAFTPDRCACGVSVAGMVHQVHTS